MRGPLHQAALALLVSLASADVAHAFAPTSDARSISVIGVETKTAVPFQPFDESVSFFWGGYPFVGAFQSSSIPADGVVASGNAGGWSSAPFFAGAESVLDVGFDLAQSSVFSLTGTLAAQGVSGSTSFQLERLAPSPAVLITRNAAGTLSYAFLGLPAGSYRLRAGAAGSASTDQTGGSGSFSFEFQLVCASATPQDSDGDELADGCDLCPFAFDPAQSDTDGDGVGDACNDAIDFDGDDYANTLDNCPADSNPDQIDADYDGKGDACDDPELITQILDPTQFNMYLFPTRLALAPNGVVYVLISNYSSVFKILPPNGPAFELYRGLSNGVQVVDIAVGPDGFVYTAGASIARCYRIHPVLGTATLLIDGTGDGQGHALTFANRVAVALDGRAFVSGRDSQNVFEIAVGGAIAQIVGPSGDGTTSLGQPQALDVDPAGNLYVLASSGSTPRLFRVTPAHQIQLVMAPSAFPSGIYSGDLALGDDGSVYVAGGGILARRPSGAIEVLLPGSDPRNATAIDVDSFGVVHAVQENALGFRVTPAGQVGPLISGSGDGQGHFLSRATDVVVTPGATKRIVVTGYNSGNAFSIVDHQVVAVPALGPAGLGLLALALLGAAALVRRPR